MELRFLLDGTEVEIPKNWKDVTIDFTLDDETRIFNKVINGDLEFHSDGYDYIKTQFDDDGFCDSITIDIEHRCNPTDEFEVVYSGIIYVAGCVFNLQKCLVSAEISDNSWHALVKTNRNIKFLLNGSKSKDDSDVTVVPVDVTFHTVTTGVALGSTRVCYRYEDAFRYVLSAITNNQVGFVSDLLSTSGDYDGAVLTTGNEIRTAGDTTAPEVSFGQLVDELYQKRQVLGAVEFDSDGNPQIRIEDASYFYLETEQDTLQGVPDILQSFDQERLYAKLLMGSKANTKFDDNTPNTSFPNVRWIGWAEEEYWTIEDCNNDTELNLVSQDFVIDSNSIENQINANNDKDDNTFIVMCSRDANNLLVADSDDFLSLGLFFYNERLNNNQTSQNWFDGVAANIAQFLGDVDNTFLANLPGNLTRSFSGSVGVEVFQDVFTNEITDPNNRYTPATNDYTAPAFDGAYVFSVLYNFNITRTWTAPLANIGLVIVRTQFFVDSGGGPVQIGPTKTTQQNLFGASGDAVSIAIDHTNSLYLNSGDIATIQTEVEVRHQFSSGAIGNPQTTIDFFVKGSEFACINAVTGGGVYQTYDPAKARVWLYDFEYPITLDQFGLFTQQPDRYRQYLNIEEGKGWVNRLSTPLTGKRSTFQLISKKELNE